MSKLISWLNRAWLVLIVAGVWIAADKLTKDWVRQSIPLHEAWLPFPALGEAVAFEHVNNYGAAFGILQNQSILFVVIAFVVVAAILFYVRYLPLDQKLIRFLLGMQLGGALGNLIDRLQRGYVTDFVRIGIPDVYYYPNFNVADSGIVIGVIGLGLFILLDDLRQQRLAAANRSPETSEM